MSDMHVTETTKWEGRENCPQKNTYKSNGKRKNSQMDQETNL